MASLPILGGSSWTISTATRLTLALLVVLPQLGACGDTPDTSNPEPTTTFPATQTLNTGAVLADGTCEDYLGRVCPAEEGCRPFVMSRYRPDLTCYESVVVACLPAEGAGCTNAAFQGIGEDGSCWEASSMCARPPQGVEYTGPYDEAWEAQCTPPDGTEAATCTP